MIKFYTKEQLLSFTMDDFKKDIIGNSFTCKMKDTSFKCFPKNVIPAQPDSLPYSLTMTLEGGNSRSISMMDIDRLTVIE